MENVQLDEYERLMALFEQNKDKTFIQRILRPEAFPTLPHAGGVATHRMAWGEADGRYFAYPTVLYNGQGLVDYGKNAWDPVMKSGNYIEFRSTEEAEWFTTRYKEAWGGKRNNVPK